MGDIQKNILPVKERVGQQLLTILPILFCSTVLMAWSWNAWPDIIVDFGRELYVPWQLLNGSTLYTDIAYLSGPLSAYFNALIFSVFGVSISALAFSNFILVNLLAVMIANITVYLTNWLTGLLVGVLYLSVFAFSQYADVGNYNFIAPYSHELTHGIILSFIGFFAIRRLLADKSTLGFFVTGLLSGLVFLTKLEVFFAFIGAALTGLGLILLDQNMGWWGRSKVLLIFIVAMLVAPLIAFVGLSMDAGSVAGGMGIFFGYINVFNADISSLYYYKLVSGLFDVEGNLVTLVASAAIFVSFLLVISLLARFVTSRPGRNKVELFYFLLVVGIIGAVFFRGQIDWSFVARGFPLIICIIAGVAVFYYFRHEKEKDKDKAAMFIVLSVFSFLLMLKIVLFATVFHYGFALLLPSVMVIAISVIYFFPRQVALDKPVYFGLKVFVITILGLFIHWHIEKADVLFSQKTVIVGNSQEKIRADWRGIYVQDALNRLAALAEQGDTLAVLPEGVMINYLARMENSTPYINLMPPEVLMFGEQKIIDSFKKNPPDYMAVVHKVTSEYGYDYFGRDYAVGLGDWISRNYQVLELIGNRPLVDNKYGILLLKKMEMVR
ncbi:MAG: hypothetical protein ABW090_08840 [Sedimenticola sp.]